MATWEWDLATDEVKWGQGIANMLGIQDAEFGGNLRASEQLVHPDDLGLVQQRHERCGCPCGRSCSTFGASGGEHACSPRGQVQPA